MNQEERDIRVMMERMHDEMVREWGQGTMDPQLGNWSSRACGKFGAELYRRAKDILYTSVPSRQRRTRQPGLKTLKKRRTK